jgi:hypothetical protein
LATSSPSPPFEGIELAVGSCLCRFGRGTVRAPLKEGREKKRRCPPLIADPEATQLARAQPAHHPAFAHLKAPSHLCRCQRPIFRYFEAVFQLLSTLLNICSILRSFALLSVILSHVETLLGRLVSFYTNEGISSALRNFRDRLVANNLRGRPARSLCCIRPSAIMGIRAGPISSVVRVRYWYDFSGTVLRRLADVCVERISRL